MSALGLPRSLHSGNAGFIFFGLSNQFVDQAVNAVRQKLDRLESLFVGFGKVNDVSVNRFVARKATGIKDRSLQVVDVERCDFIGKFGASRAEMVDQSLGRNTQRGARRSWRISVDSLSFVENLSDVFWHVFVGFDSLRLEQNNFAVLPVAIAAAYSKAEGRRAVPDGSIGYRCTFFPPDRRARDEDNLIASLKSSLDGIAQALRIDDRCFHLLEPAVREPDRPHGRVEIDLFWREEH